MTESMLDIQTEELVDVVDKDNQVIGQVTRQIMREQRLCHRATYIIVHDAMGNILVQRRTHNKDYYPDWWDLAAGGVVQSGEDILFSARREVEEELGIAGIPLADHGAFYYESEQGGIWGQLFSCVYRGPFALQEEEIAEVKWLPAEEIIKQQHEFTPDSYHAYTMWLHRFDNNEAPQ